MQDTFEKMATELQSLRPRHFMVRYPHLDRSWWFWRTPAIHIAKVKTPTVASNATRERIAELRERYAQKYLKPAKEVKVEVDSLLAMEALMSDVEPPPLEEPY